MLRNSLRELTIACVEETGEEIGRGAYGKVLVVRVNGLRCACKRLHPALIENQSFEINHVTRRFIEECQCLSKLRHPNIVQFLGVDFSGGMGMPSLVMELLPTNLNTFLDEYTNVPTYVKHSILFDVAVGLLYLHSHSPPIIHRDLGAKNVLLTCGLTAKIADLGVARTLPPRTTHKGKGPLQTLASGNVTYMPPEARKEVPSYDTKLDVFSFGHLVLHVMLQKWPMPLDEYFYPHEDDHEFGIHRTELERRKHCFEEMEGCSDVLQMLARMCLSEDPTLRPYTDKVVAEMDALVSKTPPPYSTPMDVLSALEQAREVEMLSEKLTSKETDTESISEEGVGEGEGEVFLNGVPVPAGAGEASVSVHVQIEVCVHVCIYASVCVRERVRVCVHV